uniref:Uncharacterized protein n=1 Tax=Glossina palpalis gambiensis TaxID=67801 RepID=A0A1B0APN7_9MUSC
MKRALLSIDKPFVCVAVNGAAVDDDAGVAARLRNGARVSTSELSELSLKSNALKSAFDLDISRLNSRFQSRHTGHTGKLLLMIYSFHTQH